MIHSPRLFIAVLLVGCGASSLLTAQGSAPGGGQPRSVLNYCATPGQLDQTCIDRALASGESGSVLVPAGNYSGTSLTINRSNIQLILTPQTRLNFTLGLGGTGFDRTHSVEVSGPVARGVTVLNGNFSGYSAGNTILIEQTKPTHENQSGLEFAEVRTASPTQLVLTGPTRLPFSYPTVSVITGAHIISQDLPRGARSITGHFEHDLKIGDLVRIENVRGTDSPLARPYYFEIARVAAVGGDGVTFEEPLQYAFGTPWLVRMNAANNIVVQGNGGHIDALHLFSAQNVRIDGVSTVRFNSRLLYGFTYSNLRGKTDGPTAYDLIWSWHGNVTNIDASGARSSTDNGNFKVMSVSDTTIRGVRSYDSIAYDQGTYPFMADFDYIPYDMWNVDDTFSDISTSDTHWQKGYAYGVFLGGLRDAKISNLTTTDGITLRSNSGIKGNHWEVDGMMQMRSGEGYELSDFRADVLSVGDEGPVKDSHFDRFNLAGKSTSYSSRTIWIRSRSVGLTFTNGKLAPSRNVSVYLNANCEASFDNVEDAASGASIQNDGAALFLGRNRFKGSVPAARPLK